jgi:hypothetical protein
MHQHEERVVVSSSTSVAPFGWLTKQEEHQAMLDPPEALISFQRRINMPFPVSLLSRDESEMITYPCEWCRITFGKQVD